MRIFRPKKALTKKERKRKKKPIQKTPSRTFKGMRKKRSTLYDRSMEKGNKLTFTPKTND